MGSCCSDRLVSQPTSGADFWRRAVAVCLESWDLGWTYDCLKNKTHDILNRLQKPGEMNRQVSKLRDPDRTLTDYHCILALSEAVDIIVVLLSYDAIDGSLHIHPLSHSSTWSQKMRCIFIVLFSQSHWYIPLIPKVQDLRHFRLSYELWEFKTLSARSFPWAPNHKFNLFSQLPICPKSFEVLCSLYRHCTTGKLIAKLAAITATQFVLDEAKIERQRAKFEAKKSTERKLPANKAKSILPQAKKSTERKLPANKPKSILPQNDDLSTDVFGGMLADFWCMISQAEAGEPAAAARSLRVVDLHYPCWHTGCSVQKSRPATWASHQSKPHDPETSHCGVGWCDKAFKKQHLLERHRSACLYERTRKEAMRSRPKLAVMFACPGAFCQERFYVKEKIIEHMKSCNDCLKLA
ncbi:hypothetical protein V865_000192 [Kwoniella europaea PYCC6329]|uniref:C2H2-type domain-containing protein n=1 Tax=Kwoniella europaea PYCC6329 TaxID=1423913 RepID=A0AAX4K7K4_9TREE